MVDRRYWCRVCRPDADAFMAQLGYCYEHADDAPRLNVIRPDPSEVVAHCEECGTICGGEEGPPLVVEVEHRWCTSCAARKGAFTGVDLRTVVDRHRDRVRLGEWAMDDEFGISLDPCEHPSINGTTCAACGEEVEAFTDRELGRLRDALSHGVCPECVEPLNEQEHKCGARGGDQ